MSLTIARDLPPGFFGEEQESTQSHAEKAAEDNSLENLNSLFQTMPGAEIPGESQSDGIDKRQFHKWSHPDKRGKSQALDILDLPIADDIIRRHQVILLHGKLYLYQNGFFKADNNDLLFKKVVRQYIYPELITDQRLTRVVKLLKADLDLNVEDSQINKQPKHWICFRNGFLDLKTMQMHAHDSKYRNTVQIPHEWIPEKDPSGSVTETFLKDFIKDPDDLEMFLQFSGLCMTTDMHFQKMMILTGNGGLGKSVLLRMLEWMIGSENISNLPLQSLNERFDPAFLFGKILNSYADLSSEDMRNTSGMKTIIGEDTIRAEIKGGDIFFFRPICKCIFSANRIPKSKDDKTFAYYRRLLIIHFKERAEHIPDLEEKLHNDIQSFISLAVLAAHRMYENGMILETENSKREVMELYFATDTVIAFITDCCEVNPEYKYDRDDLYSMYEMYCEREGRPALSRQGLYQNLREKGFSERFLNGRKRFIGLRFVQDHRS